MLKTRTILILFIVLINILSINAQTFTESPLKGKKKAVKEIIEWEKKAGSKKVNKGAVYFFSKHGELTSYYKNADNWGRKEYDKKQRLTKKYHNENAMVSTSNFTYKKNITSELVDYENVGQEKIDHYLNTKGQVIEKKTFTRAKKTAWVLDHRVLFTYYPTGDLKTEMHYTYHASDGTDKIKGEKVLHIFDNKKKHKVLSEYYDTRRKLFKTITYNYNTADQLIKVVEKKLATKKTKTTEYKYNKKSLARIIETAAPFKYETIYKNNRPITLKTYRYKTPKSTINYQYIYF